jgi:hypothetical protein
MYHPDIMYSIVRQQVDTLHAQAASDRLAVKAARAAKARRAGESAGSPSPSEAPQARGRWLRRHSART